MIRHLKTGRSLVEHLEFMRDMRSRTIGLTKYETAPANYAAVFEMPFFGILPGITTRGMKFPIDVLWCDKNQIVLDLRSRVKVGRAVIFPSLKYWFGSVKYVIEAPSSQDSFAEVKLSDELQWEKSK